MAIYDKEGNPLSKAFSKDGTPLTKAYNKDGGIIWNSELDYDDYTVSLYTTQTCKQGFCIFNGLIFSFDAYNQCNIIDIDTNSILYTASLTTGHGNSASFSSTYLNESDEFPLLYVFGLGQPSLVYVYHVERSGNTFTFTLYKTLSFAYTDTGYVSDGCINTESNILYMLGYTEDSAIDPDDGNNLVILSSWDLSSLTAESGLTETPTMIDKVTTDYFIYAIFGQTFHDGLIWTGTGSTTDPAAYGINPETGEIVHTITLHKQAEGEGIAWVSDSEAVIGFWNNQFYKYTFSTV